MNFFPFFSRKQKKQNHSLDFNKKQRLTGGEAESLAAEYLTKKAFEIREMNYSMPSGEVDLIAAQGDDLVFIEVKYLTHPNGLYHPEEQVTKTKQRKIIMAAKSYMQKKNFSGYCRFDVISIQKKPVGGFDIQHIVHAFEEDR